MDIQKIGALIAERRKQMGYTQETLGDILGVSGKAVSKWERGLSLPDVALFNKLAVTLKMRLGQILSGEGMDLSQSSNRFHEEPQKPLALHGPHTVDCTPTRDLGFVSPYLFGNNFW